MSLDLDILAIEPFYGGVRRGMLDTIMRDSTHRWSLLKLPPRRIERRLVAAAHWFAEHLALHAVANVDMIFASDALNLADLFRLVPTLAGLPSVVYFHTNQLPAPDAEQDITAPAAPPVLANLSTAATAQEIWFNSAYHQKCFFERTKALLARHEKSFDRDPLAELAAKSRVMLPPTDLRLVQDVQTASSIVRDKRTIFIDTRDADCQILNLALETLHKRQQKFNLIVTGPARGLAPHWPRATIPETDQFAIVQAMLKSAMFVSIRRDAFWDERLLLALAAGCWPIAPSLGVYADLIPKLLDERCMYDGTSSHLAFVIQDFWELILPEGYEEAIRSILDSVNSTTATMAIDERLVELVIAAPTKTTGTA
jgi:uncharacterized protein DUF3524